MKYAEAVSKMKAYSPDENNQFEDNYQGILTHKGEIKVAKGDVEQEILHIDENGTVLVMGREKSYPALIHVKLLSMIQFASKGDTGFIKFRRGQAFIVGFRKNRNGGNV